MANVCIGTDAAIDDYDVDRRGLRFARLASHLLMVKVPSRSQGNGPLAARPC
jgi:hypothetical protein